MTFSSPKNSEKSKYDNINYKGKTKFIILNEEFKTKLLELKMFYEEFIKDNLEGVSS